jgi:DNA-binding XRE family transcriptional regulator
MLRTERGLTRAQLAEAAGLHYQTVGYIERGEFAPSLAVALRLAALFELPVEAIFSLEPFPPLTGDQLSRRTT